MSFREFHAAVDGYIEAHGGKREAPVTHEDFTHLEKYAGPSGSIKK